MVQRAILQFFGLLIVLGGTTVVDTKAYRHSIALVTDGAEYICNATADMLCAPIIIECRGMQKRSLCPECTLRGGK